MLKNQRLNREKKIQNVDFKLKIGTINNLQPKVIYAEGSTFITPNIIKEDYSRDINEVRRKVKNRVYEILKNSDIYSDKFIFDFQISLKGLKPNKKSYLWFQIMLKQKNNPIYDFKEVYKLSVPIVEDVVSKLDYNLMLKNFSLSIKKKQ